MCNHRNSQGARYLSKFFTHWTCLSSSYCCFKAFHAYGRPGQISPGKAIFIYTVEVWISLVVYTAPWQIQVPGSRAADFFPSLTAFYRHLYLSFQFKLASCPEDQRCSGWTTFTSLWWLFWDLLNSTTLRIITIIGKTDLKSICGYAHVLLGPVVTKPD